MIRWADTFALSSINDYFGLTSAEQKEIKQDINSLIKEIQREDFPVLFEAFRSTVRANRKRSTKCSHGGKLFESAGDSAKEIFTKIRTCSSKSF